MINKVRTEVNHGIFNHFVTAPEMFHDSIVAFLTNEDDDNLEEVLFSFLEYGYTLALTFTISDSRRFNNLILKILEKLMRLDRISAHLFGKVFLFHSYLICLLYKETHETQLMQLHESFLNKKKELQNAAPNDTVIFLDICTRVLLLDAENYYEPNDINLDARL